MNTKEHFEQLFDYNDWANRRVVAALRNTSSENALKYLSHVLLTEREYYERLYGKDSTGFDFWQSLSLTECSETAKENAELFEKLLMNFDDEGLGQTAHYYTSDGTPVNNTFREVLSHVLFHSMNHRGQILTILRQEAIEPPVLDYIIYCRQQP
ncbi:MAG: DinB family protein [Pyrinomonadaceae bacterium]